MENIGPVVCFGEILWDIFPNGKKIGGAPFNVAYHLNKAGVEGKMISCVGKDKLGERLLSKLQDASVPLTEIQVSQLYDTGTVVAEFDEKNEPHYTIMESVAWDYIQWKEEYKPVIENSQAFVFGTLGVRNQVSRKTLDKILEIAPYKVFDVNLRPPFVSQVSVIEFMKKADLVKMNKSELRQVAEWIGKEYTAEEEMIKYIRNCFDLDGLIVTKGSEGALYCDADNYEYREAVEVNVKDTVGSGDAFLAGFLSGRTEGASLRESLYNAVALGAFVSGQEGACPEYIKEEFIRFKNEKLKKIT